MRVIPVIDVSSGVVVHAVGGEREKYQPVRSKLCASADPIDVALAFKSLGFAELYVADLDLIRGKGRNLDVVLSIKARTGLKIMVDAGVSSVARAREVAKAGASKVVVGTETLKDLKDLSEILKALGEDRVVVSMDLKAGNVLSISPQLIGITPTALAKKLQAMRVEELIVLDLLRVGSRLGPNTRLVKALTRAVTTPIIVGGGVRNIDDIIELSKIGVSGVMVATALHDGSIKAEEVTRLPHNP